MRRPNVLHPQWLFIRSYLRVVLAQRELVRGRVLDVGCGDRFFEQAFRGSFAGYVGLDYPATRGALPDHSQLLPPDVAADARGLPFAPETFDTVFLFEVLEHCPDPALLLAQVHAALKPGGVFIMTVPLAIPEHAQPHDYFRYTQFGLRSLLGKSGFTIERLLPIGRLGTLVAYHVNYALMEGTFSRGSTFARLLKLGLSPLVVALWLTLNVAGWTVDRLWPKPGFVMNYCVTARK